MQATQLSIVAYGAACLDREDLTAIRQQSTPRFAAALRPQLLKHSDDQTLAAVVALDRAIDQMDGTPDFSAWAVVSATRYLGRTAFAAVIDKYKIDGPWGVSVQAIPHTSPHALASSLSLALASHGPCLGAGSAPGKELQAILTSAALLTRVDVAGAWLVLSGWSDETRDGSPGERTRCHAAALALASNTAAHAPTTRSVGRIVIEPEGAEHGTAEPSDFLLWLTSGQGRGRPIEIVGGRLRLQLELFAAGENKAWRPAPHFRINSLPKEEGTTPQPQTV